MSKKIERVFGSGSALEKAPAVNYEGAPSFRRSDEESLIRVLMTGTMEPTYYADAKALAQEAMAIFGDWAKRDPEFLAQAIVYARTKGYMRLAPIVALLHLSIEEQGKKVWFRQAFRETIVTPGDLQDFVALIRSRVDPTRPGRHQSGPRGLGIVIKEVISGYLQRLTEYHAIKYGANSQEPSLRDIYRLVRPRLDQGSRASTLAGYFVKGTYEGLEQVAIYERLKKETNPEEMAWLIEEGKLPHEVVTVHIPDEPKVWSAVMHQMPIFALVRNLVTLYEHKVFDLPGTVEYVVEQLTDERRIAKSKMFPFRFLAAARMVEKKGLPRAIGIALEQAGEISIGNVPILPGRVLIANDVSGSMTTQTLSDKSDLRPADVAGVLAAALYRRCSDARIVSFADQPYPRDRLGGRHVLEIANLISRGGGGTDMGAPLEWALQNGERFDVGIFITDNQDWVRWLQGTQWKPGWSTRTSYPHGAIDLIRSYKKRLNPNFQCFFVQVMPYKDAVVPPGEPGCHFLYGWSDEVLRYIGSEANGESQVERVRGMKL